MNVLPTILLARDEEALGNIIAESLETNGYMVTHVTNGNEALRLLLPQQFHLHCWM